jgi:hypothetical protein
MNLGEEPYEADRVAAASRATFFVHSKVRDDVSHPD